jgi:hypothetical protein
LLKAAIVTDQSFADEIDRAITFILQAEVVVQVHAAFDHLAAAITFYMETVISFFRFGSYPPEEFFEKAHRSLPLECDGVAVATLAVATLE